MYNPEILLEDLKIKRIAHMCGTHPTISEEMYDEIIELVEKRVAKKPIETKTMLKCPSCNKVLMSKHYHHETFCQHCGQHVADWKEV